MKDNAERICIGEILLEKGAIYIDITHQIQVNGEIDGTDLIFKSNSDELFRINFTKDQLKQLVDIKYYVF